MQKTSRKVTSKGQVTIPIDIREKWDLEPGEMVQFIEYNGGVIIEPIPVVQDLKGSLKTDKKYNKKKAREKITKRAVERYNESA